MRNPQFVGKTGTRLGVQKTYKLFIGGKFVRGESGRVLPAHGGDRALLANYCRASRKDFRDAVVAARNAFAGWSKQSAYLRGQILVKTGRKEEGKKELELSVQMSSARRNKREKELENGPLPSPELTRETQ